VLRELASKKNLEFRRLMVGRTLSVVTLEEPGTALSGNYLKVMMREPRPSQQLIDLHIGGVSETALQEAAPLTIIS
jgi:hypothetical protein